MQTFAVPCLPPCLQQLEFFAYPNLNRALTSTDARAAAMLVNLGPSELGDAPIVQAAGSEVPGTSQLHVIVLDGIGLL